jgi:glutamate-5-semialdehyde dehydrogenase
MNDMNLEQALAKMQIAGRKFPLVSDEVVNQVLLKLADLLEENTAWILEANQRDLDKIDSNDPIKDRVMLNEQRVADMAASVREIAEYDSPIGETLEARVLDCGLNLEKVRVPLGVVGAIFEGRPNVVIDIFALCFKAKNACVLKGGSQSAESNWVLSKLIIDAIDSGRGEFGFLIDTVLLLKNDRELVAEFLKMDKYVDILVPRGSAKFIDFVRKNSTIPTIETGAGVVHTFVDESAKMEMARDIVFNAKTTRPSVCNSLDTLLVHRARLGDVAEICSRMNEFRVEIFADKECFEMLDGEYPAELLQLAAEDSFGKEYLSLAMSVKVVDSLEEAIEHINYYGSHHSEAIVTEDEGHSDKFLKAVDAAAVYVNASTRFTDGAIFGLGAEVGISTQKLHARGPMGIKELTSYKWLLRGEGEVR